MRKPRTGTVLASLGVLVALIVISIFRLTSARFSVNDGTVVYHDLTTALTALLKSEVLSNTTTAARPRLTRAYFTLISSQEYDIGAQILVCRLRHFSPEIPIYVLVDESVQLQSKPYFTDVMGAEVIQVSINLALLDPDVAKEVRSKTYTKLNIWKFDNVQTAVYLDADTVPVLNPEGLFDLLPPSKEFAVVGSETYFNSGVFVFRPSATTYHELITRLQERNYSKDAANPTEQDLLNTHFGQYQNKTAFLDGRYNYRPMSRQGGLAATAVVVHWIGNPKPWTHILGKTTTVEGLFTTVTNNTKKTSLPEWSVRLYQQEIERFFSACHDAAPPPPVVASNDT